MYSLYTHECVARFSSNTIVKFADDTVVVGLIFVNDEKSYLEEVANLSLCLFRQKLLSRQEGSAEGSAFS